LSKRLFGLLKDIGDGNGSALLRPTYAARISPAFRAEIGEIVASGSGLEYLSQEIVGPDYFMLDRQIAKFVHYRLSKRNRIVYFTFRIDTDGRVAAIIKDE
jgi:hypothetical protein